MNPISKVGILGGTFDPPHLGHLHIIEALANKFDQIMLIPTGDPYLRPTKPVATPGERLEMCSKALEDLSDELQEKVMVLDIETSRKGATYTFDTLQSLRAFFPKDEFTLILGTDAAATFHKWKRSDDVKKQVEILVVKRPGETKSGFNEIEIDALEISASQIREDFAKGINPETISPSVLKYIKDRGLYGSR
ncbi:MAG: nicotinate (nicotinamide) nucleotide adenylyltransferase [Actinobacteria bacterium]|nr:nicotinate (nicotinamide) nucleotide adenylyltransferase [Actinomycetota bacterium]MSW22621.1 nicotinate (nicotinamide) nucleotide adenylyltransferase [Actinomycetota bacterium]MSX03307.1 nicotinate (nicotinamide) nucleotide adenylyltransferase [Actinomycetota bacterium]MSX84477.1 nicotinate (nicotinamide) nucleotide adenylyltransferase [Actinomycetota bacterium]MSY96571.1 nicotinate (nicotinamide) nucleotide adenylyltransferase [Actinomycetota bacterium]